MKTIYWWHEMGDFPPDENKNSPDPLHVVSAYFLESGLSIRGVARELGLHESSAKYLLSHRVALDSIARRRDFVRILHIPPELLRLDSLHQPTFEPPFWWVEEDYPAFLVGPDGYPLVGSMVKYLRPLLKKVSPQGIEKRWTQVDLAEALGISEIVIRRLENDNQGTDSISRRTILSQMLLGGPSALFGLDTLTHPAPRLQVPAIQVPNKIPTLDTALFEKLGTEQALLFTDYYTHHGKGIFNTARGRIQHLIDTIMPLARNDQQREQIALRICNYHRLSAYIAREHSNYPLALQYTDQATSLAIDRGNQELIASTFHGRAEILRRQGDFPAAREAIDTALANVPSENANPFLKGDILGEIGLIYAHTAQDESERTTSSTSFTAAETIFSTPWGKDVQDTYFLKAGKGAYYTVRASTLLDPCVLELDRHQRKLKADEAIGHLNQAERLTSPELVLRKLTIDVFRAQALFYRGEYDEATKLALAAFEVCRQVKSRINRNRIEELYHLLSSDQCSYRGSPLVARLGWKLQTWR